MPRVECECGFSADAPARLGGKTVKCPKCAALVKVPEELMLELEDSPLAVSAPKPPEAVVEAPSPAAPRPVGIPIPPPVVHAPPPPRGPKKPAFLRWLLAAALIPLAMSITSKNDIEERFKATIEHNPGSLEGVKETDGRDEILNHFPGHRIEGAYTASDSKVHWLFALLSAGAFWGFIHFTYPRGNSTPKGMWAVGLFTGTVGIFLLLAVQWCAAYTSGVWVRGGGLLTIIFYILKFIGFSYRSALDPDTGFILSMLGFTFGVGLCEELCKALPLLWSFRRARQMNGTLARQHLLDLNGAVLWGLAAGIGFGVSEGITYAGDYYNGISTGGIYVVRFVSCVALHASWSGASAALIWKKQYELDEADNFYAWILPVLKLLAISMVLHGLYDTLLKRDMEAWALITAMASFGWFFWLHDRTIKEEEKDEEAAAGAVVA